MQGTDRSLVVPPITTSKADWEAAQAAQKEAAKEAENKAFFDSQDGCPND